MPSECEPPSSNPRQNYRWKQQQSGEIAKEPQFGELGGAVPENTARASAPSNSPSGTSNSPLLRSSRGMDSSRQRFRGKRNRRKFRTPLCPCSSSSSLEARCGGRRRRPWHFICSSVLPPLLTPRGLQNRILSAQRRATPSR